jgi:hypothetical protein
VATQAPIVFDLIHFWSAIDSSENNLVNGNFFGYFCVQHIYLKIFKPKSPHSQELEKHVRAAMFDNQQYIESRSFEQLVNFLEIFSAWISTLN